MPLEAYICKGQCRSNIMHSQQNKAKVLQRSFSFLFHFQYRIFDISLCVGEGVGGVGGMGVRALVEGWGGERERDGGVCARV